MLGSTFFLSTIECTLSNRIKSKYFIFIFIFTKVLVKDVGYFPYI